MSSTRANTLGDDADDLQKQLDNEARDKLKFGRPHTIWILHYPPKYRKLPELATTETMKLRRNSKLLNKLSHGFYGTNCVRKAFGLELSMPCPNYCWKYKDQSKWYLSHPSCGGHRQSPVDVPFQGLIHIKASRKMLFSRYDVKPKNMTLTHYGETVSIFGDWGGERPFVYGGAAHSRRYVFHSLRVRRPAEHSVGGLRYPLETQALHVSAEYGDLQQALDAAPRDRSALLIVANIYKYSNKDHEGLQELVQALMTTTYNNVTLPPLPLKLLSPPLRQYAAYHGSLTAPPCTEAALWLVRARAMPITRKLVEVVESKSYNTQGKGYNRLVQPLNDRKIYFFD